MNRLLSRLPAVLIAAVVLVVFIGLVWANSRPSPPVLVIVPTEVMIS